MGGRKKNEHKSPKGNERGTAELLGQLGEAFWSVNTLDRVWRNNLKRALMCLPSILSFFFFLSTKGSLQTLLLLPLCVEQLYKFSLFPTLRLSPSHFLQEHKLPSTFITSPAPLSHSKQGLLKLQLDIGVAFHYHQLPFLVYSKIIAIDCHPPHPNTHTFHCQPVKATCTAFMANF